MDLPPMDLRQGYELLHTDPRTLLDSCFVSLAGGGKNDISGVFWFALSMPAARQGMYKREGGSTTIPAFEVTKLSQAPAKMKYRSGENNEEHLAFEGWYVAMKRQAVQGSVPIGTLCRLSLTDGA